MLGKRIVGKHLSKHINSDVVLLGQVKKVSSNGQGIELLTFDNVSVNVNLPDPVDGSCEGFFEVHGTALSNTTVSCKSYVHFPPEASENFDPATYNAFLLAVHVIGDRKWKINEDDESY